MFPEIVLCLLSYAGYGVLGQSECTDLRGRHISHGLHYVPGPDTCTLCVCDNGLPKICKAVLCSPPQDCRSFRVGNTCCEFICLDDVVKPAAEGSDLNLRMAATGVAIVILFGIAVVVYRVKKQKIEQVQHADDQRSLTSIGYISGSMCHMGGTCETALAAWKPPGHYLPRGEAPPPYDEAVAQSQQHRLDQYQRPYPNVDAPIPDHQMHYNNMPRPQQQMANPQGCYAAPLLQPMTADSQIPMPHPLAANLLGFHRSVRLTGSLGTISGRGLAPRDMAIERPRHLPPYYTRSPALHRTIPRMSAAVDPTIVDAPLAFARVDRSGVPCDVRRSFHKPAERIDTGRSMPRNLNLASVETEPVSRQANTTPPPRHPEHNHHPAATRSVSNELPRSEHQSMTEIRRETGRETAHRFTGPIPKPAVSECGLASTLPVHVDKPSCVCSYESGAPGAGADEMDDYRNECENCKSASSSRWVLEEPWRDEEETQTLQRRAPQPSLAPATATLPQRQTKQTRPLIGPPSNWDNWFSAIPDSDTESEE